MPLWGRPSKAETPVALKEVKVDPLMVRQAVAEIQEACGQIVQFFDPVRYENIYGKPVDFELAYHRLREAATNLEDAAKMLRLAAPQVPGE